MKDYFRFLTIHSYVFVPGLVIGKFLGAVGVFLFTAVSIMFVNCCMGGGLFTAPRLSEEDEEFMKRLGSFCFLFYALLIAIKF